MRTHIWASRVLLCSTQDWAGCGGVSSRREELWSPWTGGGPGSRMPRTVYFHPHKDTPGKLVPISAMWLMHLHIHVHIHSYTHANAHPTNYSHNITHTLTHACTHTITHPLTPHTYARTHSYPLMPTHAHRHIQPSMYSPTQTHMHAHVSTTRLMHIFTTHNPSMHTLIHTRVHAHSFTHPFMHTRRCLFLVVSHQKRHHPHPGPDRRPS